MPKSTKLQRHSYLVRSLDLNEINMIFTKIGLRLDQLDAIDQVPDMKGKRVANVGGAVTDTDALSLLGAIAKGLKVSFGLKRYAVPEIVDFSALTGANSFDRNQFNADLADFINNVRDMAYILNILVRALTSTSEVSNLETTTPPPPSPPPPSPPPPTPPVVPPGALTFPWDDRIEVDLTPGTDLVYVANIAATTNTVLRISVIGQTNETDVSFIWTFPDGNQFTGSAFGTSVNGLIYLRSQQSYSPNLPDYDYIPDGDHLFRITPNAQSRLVIRGVVYA